MNRKMVSIRSLTYLQTARAALGKALCCAACLFALLVQSALAESAAQPAIGEVSLILGKAYISGPGRAEEAVRVGTQIHVSDQIVTEANGHVHVRFIDDALVSVRPFSLLEIVRYDYNPAQPEDSSIKLNLLDGVTRSISGDAAKSARERFRMDTPIAAIGVRGTDFVVSASQRTVRAIVNEGAIVVAPYSSECRMDALGPCALDAVELTENTMQLVEMAENQQLPRLLPVPEQELDGLMRDEVAQNTPQNSDDDAEARSADVYQEAVSAKDVTEKVAAVPAPPPVKPKPPEVVLPDFTPAALLAESDLVDRQLVWGRYAEGQGSRERITVALNTASAAGEVAVGNAGYQLYRREDGSKLIRSGLGQVAFDLHSAQAFLNTATGTSAMRVDGGNLDINFDSRQFSTVLRLDHSITGRIDFSSSGRISSAGYFNNRNGQTMTGAVSIDGSEAAYTFVQQIKEGSIQGQTLWGNQ